MHFQSTRKLLGSAIFILVLLSANCKLINNSQDNNKNFTLMAGVVGTAGQNQGSASVSIQIPKTSSQVSPNLLNPGVTPSNLALLL